jgi:hypothetical protein
MVDDAADGRRGRHEVAQAVEATAAQLAGWGITSSRRARSSTASGDAPHDRRLVLRVRSAARRLSPAQRHAIGPDTLEPITFKIYEYARTMKSAAFITAIAGINTARRQLARFLHAARRLAVPDDGARGGAVGHLQSRPD